MIDVLVEKELKEVFYDRPANWFAYIKALVNISLPDDADAENFDEIKATRDVFVHGQGIANAYYVDKARAAARAPLGQPLTLLESYRQQSWELICNLVHGIGIAMSQKA